MTRIDTLARRHGTRMARVGANLFRAGYEAGLAQRPELPADGGLVQRAVESTHERLVSAAAGEDAMAIIREEIERLIRDAMTLASAS